MKKTNFEFDPKTSPYVKLIVIRSTIISTFLWQASAFACPRLAVVVVNFALHGVRVASWRLA